MRDTVALRIGNQEVRSLLSYRIDADLYQAAGEFEIELDPTTAIDGLAWGQKCTLTVNDTPVLTGIIDRVNRGYQKAGSRLRVKGRDLMAIAIDSCCERYITISSKTIAQVAQQLLSGLDHIGRSAIRYSPEAFALKAAQEAVQIEPGQSVFDVLRTMALNRGLLFYCLADGTLVFDRPKSNQKPRYQLRIKDGQGGTTNENGVLEAEVTEDCSKYYSKIVVVGQSQGIFEAADQVNVKVTATVDDAPITKTLVVVHNGDGTSPAQTARMLREQQASASRRIEYSVAGHTQHADPWQIDELVYVWDDRLGVPGETRLITGRTFELTKDRGPITRLRLGVPGVVQ